MPTIPESRILDLIGAMYDIAGQASKEAWQDVCAEMRTVFNADRGSITVVDTKKGQFKAFIGAASEEFIRDYMDRFQHISPFRKVLAGLKAGDRFNRQEHLSDEDFSSSEIYQRFYATEDIFHIEYQVFMVRPGLHGGITFTRGKAKDNFDKDEISALKRLVPHLERAFRLYISLLDSNVENKVMAKAFDRIPQGVIVANRERTVVFANNSGKELLDGNDGLSVDVNGKLRASNENDDRKISVALENLFASEPSTTETSCLLKIQRPSGWRPLELMMSLSDNEHRAPLSEDRYAIAFVSDPDRSNGHVEEMLTEIYGLTMAESRIASLLVDGRSLNEICETFAIKPNTARTHLKHIFSKTHTNRQGELIKLILNGPGNLRGN